MNDKYRVDITEYVAELRKALEAAEADQLNLAHYYLYSNQDRKHQKVWDRINQAREVLAKYPKEAKPPKQ